MTALRTPRLVVGDDGSASSDVAWLWVNNHHWPGWQADVVHAEPLRWPPPAPDSAPEPLREWDPPSPRVAFTESGIGVLRHLTRPSDPRILLDEQDDADLVVVGSAVGTHLGRLWRGSVTEWLVARPPVPVLVVRSAAPTCSVLACIDGSVHAQRAVEAFARLPWAAGCVADLLTVRDPDSPDHDGIAAAAATLEAAGVVVKTSNADGPPTDAILEHVRRTGPQLALVGTRGILGWRRLRLGSTAGALTRSAPCSVLVAGPPPEEST